MRIKRLLDDRKVHAGDSLFDAQGRFYAFVEHSGGELVVKGGDGRPTRFKPDELEMLGRELGLISESMVGRKLVQR